MTSTQVAQTIFDQLGGGRFLAMTGAKNMVYSADSLMFSLPARFAKNKINKVRITLDASDTYTVECFYIKGADVTTIASSAYIYGDRLRDAFTRMTGLDASL